MFSREPSCRKPPPVSLSTPFFTEVLWRNTSQEPNSEHRTWVAPAWLCRGSRGSEGTSDVVPKIRKPSWEKQSPPPMAELMGLTLSCLSQVGDMEWLLPTCPSCVTAAWALCCLASTFPVHVSLGPGPHLSLTRVVVIIMPFGR